MDSLWKNEIVELHEFFEEWFGGENPPDNANRFETVLSPEFRLISPHGTVHSRTDIIDAVRSGKSSRLGVEIRVRSPELRFERGDIIVATYEELQRGDDLLTARLSTVVFELNDSLPNGLSWLHVHETWLPEL